jgi:hypothetical protein
MAIVTPGPVTPLAGPCGPARNDVQTRCADAERLTQAALAHQQRLRDVNRELAEVTALRETDARVRDRRRLDSAKSEARSIYHSSILSAREPVDVHEAARVWLREIDGLNRQLADADVRAEDLVRRANELEQALPSVELAADAARIAAEAAQASCLDARAALADCEELAQRQIDSGAAAAAAAAGAAPGDATPLGTDTRPQPRGNAAERVASRPAKTGVRPISIVLRGDRDGQRALAVRLAEETGLEAGQLQLLLLELRESIAACALDDQMLRFPPNHPFWSQFPATAGRDIAASLASMGYVFDGHNGWAEGRTPAMRELAMALSEAGLDPRVLLRPADPDTINSLWRGTIVLVEDYLAARAPDLDLQQVTACLGRRAAPLSELWDMWGRLRVLLLTPA